MGVLRILAFQCLQDGTGYAIRHHPPHNPGPKAGVVFLCECDLVDGEDFKIFWLQDGLILVGKAFIPLPRKVS